MKEVLPVAQALGLTVRSWEVRGADDFDGVFAAMGKRRLDGLYVTDPLMILTANGSGFALKSRFRRYTAAES